jgi:single-strand DNA-binding protein
MGRICHDLELKTTPNGVSVLSFRLAVERNYQVKGEDKKSDFFNIIAWRSNAEFISRYFGKGRMILIDGELRMRQYVDKNNITRDIAEIITGHVRFTGEPKPQSPQGGAHQSAYSPPATPAPVPAPTLSQGDTRDFVDMAGVSDDDYPF